ncbi:MAG: hypothetical protein LUI13_15800 [Lachnospiraceae bacterium]|nr:hypothetical protein [Lachnospiraceae bacterium]
MKVNTNALRNSSDQMSRDIRTINGILNETDEIRRQLKNYKSLETACGLLNIWEQSTQGKVTGYRRFQRFTEAAADKYDRCEKKVSRRVGKYTIRRYPPVVVFIRPIPRKTYLMNLIISPAPGISKLKI